MTADDTRGRPLVIGHRGASGYRPEHTRAAYELAFALGADAVEPDLVATRDGVLVIRHENEISTTTDVAAHPEFAGRRRTTEVDGVERTGWFTEDFTWAELTTLRCRERLGALRPLSRSFDGRYRMLRFRDLLDLLDRVAEVGCAAGAPGLVAEVKHPTHFAGLGLPLVELMADELRAHGGVPGALTVECFEPSALAEARRQGVDGELVYLVEASGAPADRVARDGAAARGYDQDVTPEGLRRLAEIPAGRGQDAAPLIAGVSVNARLLVDGAAGGGAPARTSLVADAHAVGLDVYCWTLRAENAFLPRQFRRGDADADIGDWSGAFSWVCAGGVDGVFADQPDLAIAARDGS